MDAATVTERVMLVAEEVMRQRTAGALAPHWGDAVLIQALTRLGDKRSTASVVECASEWLDEKLANLDLSQPAWEWGYIPVAAWELASTTGRPQFGDHAQRIVDHISSAAPRVDGVMTAHAGRPQLWVDSMFFSLPALYRASRETATTRYRDDADAQFLGYLEHLMDPATSFFIHCWDHGFQAPARYAVGSFEPLEEAPAWARGNAWALLALMEGIANSQSKQFRPAARQLAARVAEVHTDSGGWHTVLDRPDTYVETSASAMFALAFLKGVQLGVLSADYARLAELTWDWLQGHITLNRLTGVSAGTPPGNVLDYQRVSVGSETFGDGFLILLGLELNRIGSQL